MRCLYCNREKEDITGEHVIPRGIGGNIKPTNPFKLREVCSGCNHSCGRYIDGPFIRSWFTQQGRATSAVHVFKPGATESLPLNYMGLLPDVSFGSRICESWLGPTGDRIFHFHEPYPLEPDSPIVVGPPPHLPEDEVDPGFVFLFVRSNNPVWWPVIVSSVIEQFTGAQFFLGNGPMPRGGAFGAISSELIDLHQMLMTLGAQYHTQGRISVDYGSRFLGKLALGIGGLFLDSSFRSSSSADLLRDFLWTKRLEERQRIPVRGRNFLAGEDRNFRNVAAFLRWRGGHLLLMLPKAGYLLLYAAFFEGQAATIAVSNEPQHWQTMDKNDGVTYVISPGLHKCVGPVKLTAFIAHRMGLLVNASLKELEDEEQESPLPPFDV